MTTGGTPALSAAARPLVPFLTVGLTGGIAAGKSVVDAMFETLGASVIDADTIVHALLAPGGGAVGAVVAAFGPSIAPADGGVDRAALGGIVFRDSAARARLERIVHPLVTEEIDDRIEKIRREGGSPIVIVDAALLVETGASKRFDRLVVVTCTEERQVERLAARGFDRDEALRRIRAQAPAETKAAQADYRIDNDGSLESTRSQVERVYRSLLEDFERKRRAERPEPKNPASSH